MKGLATCQASRVILFTDPKSPTGIWSASSIGDVSMSPARDANHRRRDLIALRLPRWVPFAFTFAVVHKLSRVIWLQHV